METNSNKYRFSSYSIPVDLENAGDKVMLIHGYTGAIDIANGNILSFLKSNKSLSKESAPFSENTWNAMLARGYITTKTIDEERAYVARMADAFHRRNKLFNGFTFIPSYDCNFRCPYCVEAQISKNGQQWKRNVFTREMIDKAYRAISEIGPHEEFNIKQILLYGGEPLLKENKDVVSYIVKKGHELGYKFKAITNGYDLEEYEDLLGPNLIYALQITVDGTKHWHDQRRIHYQNGGTFDKIIGNIRLALDKKTGVAVRVNTDKNNFKSLDELRKLFEKLKFYDDSKLFSMHAGWLYSNKITLEGVDPSDYSTETKGNIDYFDFKDLNQEIKKAGFKVSVPSDPLYSNLLRAITGKGLLSLSPTGCSSQSGAYVFDPDGNIFSCLEVVGKPQYILGNYAKSDKIQWNEMEVKKWHSLNISTIPKCSKCKYAFLCNGGCVLKKIRDNKENKTCENFPKMFEIAVNKAYNYYLKHDVSCSLDKN
jgi:uncharacterized protein